MAKCNSAWKRNDVQNMFDKYTTNFVRRLNKEKSVEMLMKEFSLNQERAGFMFKIFTDQDPKGQMSIWQFQHFYTCFGENTNMYLDNFEKIQKEDGQVNYSEMWDFLKELRTLSGRCVGEEELESMIKSKAGEEKTIDLEKFTELIKRIKMIRS